MRIAQLKDLELKNDQIFKLPIPDEKSLPLGEEFEGDIEPIS